MIPIFEPLKRYLEKKAHAAWKKDGVLPIDIVVTLYEVGLDAEELEDTFQLGYDPTKKEDESVVICCSYEDIEEIVDAAIGNNIERLLDIKTACDQVI